MLKELNRYENLGTPKFFHELFQQLSFPNRRWTKDNVIQYFYNRIVDDRAIFDGCLPLAEAVGAIIVDQHGFVNLNPNLQTSLINERYLSNKLLEMILAAAKSDKIFYEIFCSENISYDIIYRLVQIENTAFNLRYSNFRQLLVNFNFLYPHPDGNIKKFIINSKHKKLFDREMMPEIKRRKVGIDELEKMLAQKQIYGNEAEVFVLQYEKTRMFNHPSVNSIEMISEYDVAAGYDIVSYQSVDSPEYDRFIEVKSYSRTPSFHWSRNEIDVSRIKKDQYFLYLIDRDKIANQDYEPLMIQNPHEKIIEQSSGWDKRVEGYFVTKSI